MKKLTEFVLKRRRIILLVVSILLIVSGILSTKVEINDNLLDYIPSDIESIEAGDIIYDEFNDHDTIRLLVKDMKKTDADLFVDGIINDEDILVSYTVIESRDNSGSYLYTVSLSEDYTQDTLISAVSLIEDSFNDNEFEGGVLSGTATFEESDMGMSTMMFVVTISVIALMILLFSKSYFDVVIILGTVVIAIVLNMGTNYMFGTISSASFTAGSLIQLAVSIDYSLFIITKYNEGKKKGLDLDNSIIYAVDKGSKSVMAGAITTIAGFAALLTMRYELGVDLGLVLAKGVFLSLLCAIILVPIFIRLSHKILKKTEHKNLIPNLSFISKGAGTILSPIIFVLVVILAFLTYSTQGNADFRYGEPHKSENKVFIDDNFDLNNTILVLIENDQNDSISDFKDRVLEEVDGIETNMENNQSAVLYWDDIYSQAKNLLLACSFNPTQVPEGTCDFIPPVTMDTVDSFTIQLLASQGVERSTFISQDDEYQRIFIMISDDENRKESDEIFTTVSEIRTIAKESFGDEAKLTGESAVLYDLKEVSTNDFKIVSIVSITLVLLVVMISFKSFTIPFLLVLVIQTAIWLNMSVAVVFAQPLLFLGYLMVSSVQLGATIDYSILITENYHHNRFVEQMSKKDAIKDALDKSIHPVMVSAFALAVGGFVLMLMSTGSNAELGLLIGRGALMSILLSILVLPHLLVLFDKVISKTTIRSKK